MDLERLKIGYVPYGKSLIAPGNRRRFWYYAQQRNIRYEIADPTQDYDIVFVTCLTDLYPWINYPKKCKIVFELIDSYLAIPRSDIKGKLKGFVRYITRKDKHLQLNYWKTLESMCHRADAVVCSTEEQRKDISKHCHNIHIILDVHSSVAQTVKSSYIAGDVFNLVWEGLPVNVQSLTQLSEVLENLKDRYKLALHLITDLQYGQYMNRYWMRNTKAIAKQIFDHVYLYEWNEQLCSKIITSCDLAVIPLPINDPLASGKPENKLLLFWRMGMPTLVSATPAYKRAMDKAGLSMTCQDQEDWQNNLIRFIESKVEREKAGQKGKACAESHYSEEKILRQWDNLFTSILN